MRWFFYWHAGPSIIRTLSSLTYMWSPPVITYTFLSPSHLLHGHLVSALPLYALALSISPPLSGWHAMDRTEFAHLSGVLKLDNVIVQFF